MNNFLKVCFAAAAIGGTWWGVEKLKGLASKFKFDIVGYGRPTIVGWNITVPLIIRFTNPALVPIAADRVQADVYIKKGGQWVAGAHIDQPISIPPGESEQAAYPKFNIANIFGGNLLTTLTSVQQALQSKSLEVRTDVTVSYGNVSLPVQSFIETIPLA